MPKFTKFKTETPWVRLTLTDEDRKKEPGDCHARMLEQIFIIREFEEKILELHGEGLVHGPAHASIGQEGGAVGIMSQLAADDKINGTHRMHHQFLAKVLNYATPEGYDPRNGALDDNMREMIVRTMAEIMGLSPGFCGGRGGSMHLRFDEAGVLGSNAIVGGNPPHAAGYAFADKWYDRDRISVAFFGDGAIQQGAAYESMNLAALYELPVIFFCENNQYAVSTNLREQTRETRLSSRGLSLGVPGINCDGMDPVAVRLATEWALDIIKKERGPVLIEADTYRHLHQSGPLKGSAFGYRTKEEEDDWQKRDPCEVYPAQLVKLGVVKKEQVAELQERAREVVEWAAGELTEVAPDSNARRIVPALWPDSGEVEFGIRGDLSEFDSAKARETDDYNPQELEEVKLVEAIPMAILHNMQKYDGVVVFGEDVHRLRGGTAGATRGIDQHYPNRLIGTPICENGFTGLALGAAINGMRPIVEIMYPDFVLMAADQLFNQAAKVRHMFGGNYPVPLVVRSRVAAGTGYGSQHSMDASGLFACYPGWRIVAPSTPFDYIGLMNAAIQCDDPVLVVEYQDLFQETGLIPAKDLDYVVPLGKARTVKSGSECTMLVWAEMVKHAPMAAEALGIDAEIIDLRTIDPLGLDWDAVEASVRKTNRLMIAEETTRGTSVGARIVEMAQERLFDWLDHEIVHVTGTDSSPVVSKVLEEAALAGQAEVETGLQALMGRGQQTAA
ncbi:MAG: MFS transporter [Alphaproteobacteria bacterium]|nr:MFS transporter [Alphaproteobacteria bacterium]